VLSHLVTLSVIPAGVLADSYGVPLIVGSLAGLALIAHAAAVALSPGLRRLS
jgi:hypothetical protein